MQQGTHEELSVRDCVEQGLRLRGGADDADDVADNLADEDTQSPCTDESTPRRKTFVIKREEVHHLELTVQALSIEDVQEKIDNGDYDHDDWHCSHIEYDEAKIVEAEEPSE